MLRLRRSLIFIFFGILLILFATASVAEAKGNFNKVIVYGDGQAIESNDSSFLEFNGFFNFGKPYPGTPTVVDEGYLIVRYGMDQDTGEYIAFDSLRLFTKSLASGSKPFVYYEGLVNGWSEYDHQWYEANPNTTATLQKIVEQASKSQFQSVSTLLLSGLGGLSLVVLTIYLTRNRKTSLKKINQDLNSNLE